MNFQRSVLLTQNRCKVETLFSWRHVDALVVHADIDRLLVDINWYLLLSNPIFLRERSKDRGGSGCN